VGVGLQNGRVVGLRVERDWELQRFDQPSARRLDARQFALAQQWLGLEEAIRWSKSGPADLLELRHRLAVSSISARTRRQLLQQRVFRAFGMTSTRWRSTVDRRRRFNE